MPQSLAEALNLVSNMRARGRFSLRRSALAALALSLFIVTCAKDSAAPPPGPTQLAFKVDPTDVVAGSAIAVVVEARDANGAVVADFSGSVTISISTNPGSGTLGGTTTAPAVSGVATFNTLNIDKSGAGYRLKATSGSLTAATSAAFDIAAGPASELVFGTLPPSGTAGTGITPAVTVTARDDHGNVADGFTASVTVEITSGSGTPGATLTGTTTQAAVAGIATFAGLSIDKVGPGYTLSATGGALPTATSTPIDIIAGLASQLVISVQPSSVIAGQTISPAVVVTALDNQGNTASGFGGFVTLAVTPGTGTPGATLGGTSSVTAVAGVATFTTLSIAKAGTAYTLEASAASVTGVTTDPFDIAIGPASQLAFVVDPTATFAGAPIAPAVQVVVRDAAGNTDTTYTDEVTVALGANPGSATLSGTTTVAAVAGIATFADLKLDKSGTAYTLTAAAAGLTGATSIAFDNLAAAGSQLVFLVGPPTTTVAGAGIAPAIQVAVQDAFGNTATAFNGSVTLAIGANPAGGTLSGSATVGAVEGVATFPGLSIDRAGTGYTLTASASVLTDASTAAFDVVPGAADHLVFGQQPTAATAGTAIAPDITVRAMDALGNLVTSFSEGVTVAISAGSGTSGALLSGATTATAVGGVASFGTLSIDKSGTGYTLVALSTGLTDATSGPFDIAAGAAMQLVVSIQPGNTTAGSPIAPSIVVRALDGFGNDAISFTGDVTIAISAGTGTAGATLAGTITAPAVGGVATFDGLSIDKAGTGYTLVATAGGLSEATTTAFDIMVGTAAKLVFTAQPGTTIAGVSIGPLTVTAQDAAGNTVADFTQEVTLAIGMNPSAGSLTGAATVAAVAGVATFGTLSIDKSGTGYTLAATATGLPDAASTAFDITPGPAALLTFSVPPNTAAGGVNITPAVVVTALDQLGNVATGFTGNVRMAIGTNPSAGTLSGDTSRAAVAGVATFSTLKIDKAGIGYTLTASATGPAGATSAPFDISIGAAAKLAFSAAPGNTVAGTAIAPAVAVTVQDAAGNTVTTYVGDVSVAITSGTGTAGALLRGTATLAAVNGVASFSTLSIDKSGNGYKLTTTSGSLTAATSGTFNITPAPAIKLGFTVQPPATATAGTSMSPTIRVAAQDSLGNTVTTFNSNIVIAIGTNPSGGALTGTTTVKASSGVSSYSTLKINLVGIGYTLVATSTGLLDAISTPITVNPGSATHLGFTVQPLSTRKGTVMPSVSVAAFDAQGNLATGFTSNITMALGANPNFGTLGGTKVVKAVAGVSNFSTLTVDSAGNGYTLSATASGQTGATSDPFDITSGDHLEFTVQPAASPAGGIITPAVQVSAMDTNGAVLTGFTGNVTVALVGGTGTPGAVLTGTKTVAAVAGVATFADLRVDLIGSGYKLSASASGLAAATSAAFTTTGGIAVKVAFIVQPASTPAGAIIQPGVQVAVQDAGGATIKPYVGSVTLAIGNNPGGGTLSGTLTAPVNAGVASFPNLSINNVGTNYTLVATSAGLTGATSSPFNITAAAAVHLVFSVQPVITTAGQAIPTVEVQALNSSNALVTSFTGPVTIAIAAGTGATNAFLFGTTVVNAVNGVASFPDLSIQKAGTGYKLSASSPGTAGVNSASFAINADVAATAHFSTQPVTTAAGATIPSFQVDVRDQFNNVAKTYVGSVTLTITGGTGTPGAVLSGTTTQTLVAGVATFSDLSINLPGTGNNAYRLTATIAGLTTDLSDAFSIN